MTVNHEITTQKPLTVKLGRFKNEISHIYDTFSRYDSHVVIYRYISWSTDDKNFSQPEPLSSFDFSQHVGHFLRLHYEITSPDPTETITLKSVDVLERDTTVHISQGYDTIGISQVLPQNMYDFEWASQQCVPIETHLNYFLNKQSGVRCMYFHTNPDRDTQDEFLNEYSLHNVVCSKPFKVICRDNAVPEVKLNSFSSWGIEFERLEVYVEKTYFEEEFGVNERPRSFDYIYFKELNRMYCVTDAYLQHGVDEVGQYYVLNVKKYEDVTAVSKSADELAFLDELQIRQDNEQQRQEMTDMTNPQQNYQKTIVYDNVRMEVINIQTDDKPMRYRGFDFSLYGYKQDDKTQMSSIDYKPTITNTATSGFSFFFWAYAETDDFNLKFSILDDGGINVSIPLKPNTWRAIVIDVNCQHSYLSVYAYEIQNGKFVQVDRTSAQIDPSSLVFKDKTLSVDFENLRFRHFRMSNYCLQPEHHSLILTSRNIKKASAFWIIDDCEPITNQRTLKKTVFPDLNREHFDTV